MGRSATGCSQAAEQLCAAYQWKNSDLMFSIKLDTPAQPRNILRTVETAAAKSGHGRRRRAHPAPLRSDGAARGRRAHQSGGRSARALPFRLEASCSTRSDGVRAQTAETSNLVQVRQGKLSPVMVIVAAGVVIQVCERHVVAKIWVPASWEVHASLQRVVVDAGE